MTDDDVARWADEFRLLPGETLAGVLADYDEVARGPTSWSPACPT